MDMDLDYILARTGGAVTTSDIATTTAVTSTVNAASAHSPHSTQLTVSNEQPTSAEIIAGLDAFPQLSSEQMELINHVDDGRDVIVDATVGSGKTTAIQALCASRQNQKVLYLTYNKSLKVDARARVTNATVHNYHAFAFSILIKEGIKTAVQEQIAEFNRQFKRLSKHIPRYDLLVIDEYQDIRQEFADMLVLIKSLNPLMQVVMVGDMEQKIQNNTTLDVQKFITKFCDNPVKMAFTQSFRMGPTMAKLLSEGWNKTIVGANKDQKISYMTTDEVVAYLGTKQPEEILCLGKRQHGQINTALNKLEKHHPEKFNKKTTFATIRDKNESGVSYGKDSAVFTTFDSSKGLERPICVVFDYNESYWDARIKPADSDATIIRNVFLVGASRGKQEIIFVTDNKTTLQAMNAMIAQPKPTNIGEVPTKTFIDLPIKDQPVFNRGVNMSDAFDFKYKENVDECYNMLEIKRLDDENNVAEDIHLPKSDYLIDLSPVVGIYQELVYFENNSAMSMAYSILAANYPDPSKIPQHIKKRVHAIDKCEKEGDLWRTALLLTALTTDQDRYVTQVTTYIDSYAKDQLISRLATQLPADASTQEGAYISGVARSRNAQTTLNFQGVIDVNHDGKIWELKFASNLNHEMFLQLGMYLVATEASEGIIWNIKTDERWSVKVPDPERFLDAVTRCVSKQYYSKYVTLNRMRITDINFEYEDD